MARIKFGAIVTDARGKLGGHYFNKAKGVATLATKPNAPSQYFFQKNNRLRGLVKSMQLWSALSTDEKRSINMFASSVSMRNEFGDSGHLSGRAMGMRLMANVELCGIDVPDWVSVNNHLKGVSFDYSPLSGTQFRTFALEPFGRMMIYFYNSTVTNSSFDKTRLRFLESVEVSSGEAVYDMSAFLSPEDFDRFNQVYSFVALKEVNEYGFTSAITLLRFFEGRPSPF